MMRNETYLKIPPPLASVHFRIDLGFLVGGGVVFLGGVGQKLCKLRIHIECTDTLDDIPVVEFVLLTCNCNFLPDKLRKPVRGFFVNDAVEFLCAQK